MTKMKAKYVGQFGTENIHTESGTILMTDASKDNKGLGRSFSPTDLIAIGLVDCMFTTMAIITGDTIDITGMTADVEKIMTKDLPRKIESIKIDIYVQAGKIYTKEEQEKLVQIAKKCPASLSLHPSVIQDITWHW